MSSKVQTSELGELQLHWQKDRRANSYLVVESPEGDYRNASQKVGSGDHRFTRKCQRKHTPYF
jgi:hypothetical protein